MAWFRRKQRAPRSAPPPRPGEPAPAGGAEAILEDLCRAIVEQSDGSLTREQIDVAGDLVGYGYVDSLTAATLLERIEERYGVEVSELDLVGRLSTLQALADHIRSEISASG